jgi:hypothetical protein
MGKRDAPSRCAWCNKPATDVSKDHIFPYVLGGTRELSVPACSKCQTEISKFELEVGRSSPYSMFLLEQGRKGRDVRKPTSGFLRTRYCLVRHPLGGYGEACVRVGEDTPGALPHLEIDIFTKLMRRRGANPRDVDHLVEVLLELVNRIPDAERLVQELYARTENIPEISSDPDFWPRVVLDISGKPFIRARNKKEARFFAELLIAFLKAGAFRDYSRWSNTEISGGTPHLVQLRCRESSLHRLAAKVTFGLAWICSTEVQSQTEILRPLRELVLGQSATGRVSTAVWAAKPNSITAFPNHHAAMVTRLHDRLRGLTSFYGDCSVVELALTPESLTGFETIVAISRKDGTKTEVAEGRTKEDIVTAFGAWLNHAS